MGNHIIDLKVMLAGVSFWVVSFSDADAIMKTISFFLVCGFTLRRWYLMEKNKKDNENN